MSYGPESQQTDPIPASAFPGAGARRPPGRGELSAVRHLRRPADDDPDAGQLAGGGRPGQPDRGVQPGVHRLLRRRCGGRDLQVLRRGAQQHEPVPAGRLQRDAEHPGQDHGQVRHRGDQGEPRPLRQAVRQPPQTAGQNPRQVPHHGRRGGQDLRPAEAV